MSRRHAGVFGARPWFLALAAVSALLLVVTFIAYALVGSGVSLRLLFWVGLGGENNIGAWWSGMLLVLAAFFAFDGYASSDKPVGERRGWLSLGLALLLLSFDELASLHEFLLRPSRAHLAALGAFGVAGLWLAGYGMAQLHRAKVPARVIVPLLFAFILLASVPLHEIVQNTREWPDPIVYGGRAMLEEGTELIAMLLFVAVTHVNSASLLRASQDFLVTPVQSRRLIAGAAALLWAPLTAATFVLQNSGSPADWLAASLFLLCALLATRAAVMRGKLDAQSICLIVFYVGASAAANAVSFKWSPTVLGVPISVRGLAFAMLLVSAVVLLRANQRRMYVPRTLLIAAAIAGSAIVWPTSQLLWCGLPPALALWLYSIESKAAALSSTVPEGEAGPLSISAAEV